MPKKIPKNPGRRGKMTTYTPELGTEIAETIASSELGLIHLCKQNPHWPDRATIFTWRRVHADFRDKYTRAKEEQTEVTVEYMQELMNEPHRIVDEETGAIRIDVPMLRLKIETMKWQAGKLKPKKFGDSTEQKPANTELDDDCKKRYAQMDDRNKKDY
jgi:hypothetical protein